MANKNFHMCDLDDYSLYNNPFPRRQKKKIFTFQTHSNLVNAKKSARNYFLYIVYITLILGIKVGGVWERTKRGRC